MVPAAHDIALMARRLVRSHGFRRARRIAGAEARRAGGGPVRAMWLEVRDAVERLGALTSAVPG